MSGQWSGGCFGVAWLLWWVVWRLPGGCLASLGVTWGVVWLVWRWPGGCLWGPSLAGCLVVVFWLPGFSLCGYLVVVWRLSGQATSQRVARELPLGSESCQRVVSLARHTPAPSNKGRSVCLPLSPACLDGPWGAALLLWMSPRCCLAIGWPVWVVVRLVVWGWQCFSGRGPDVGLQVAWLLWRLPGGRLACLGVWSSGLSGGGGLVAACWLSGFAAGGLVAA